MDRKQLAELLRYSSPFSILVVTYKNEIVELSCPFKVEVVSEIGDLKKGEIKSVEMVKLSVTLITVYIVDAQHYYYYHFDIIINE